MKNNGKTNDRLFDCLFKPEIPEFLENKVKNGKTNDRLFDCLFIPEIIEISNNNEGGNIWNIYLTNNKQSLY